MSALVRITAYEWTGCPVQITIPRNQLLGWPRIKETTNMHRIKNEIADDLKRVGLFTRSFAASAPFFLTGGAVMSYPAYLMIGGADVPAVVFPACLLCGVTIASIPIAGTLGLFADVPILGRMFRPAQELRELNKAGK